MNGARLAVGRSVLALGILVVSLAHATVALEGRSAPDFALRGADGAAVRLSEYRGQIVLVTFWAEACGRCIQQLDRLGDLQRRYRDRDVEIVAVNIDREAHAPRTAARGQGITVLHDADQSVARQYELSRLPLAVIVDPHGIVRHVHDGYGGGDDRIYDDELAALLREYTP